MKKPFDPTRQPNPAFDIGSLVSYVRSWSGGSPVPPRRRYGIIFMRGTPTRPDPYKIGVVWNDGRRDWYDDDMITRFASFRVDVP